MTDTLTPEQRRKVMQKVKSKDTHPEMVVRRLLHKAGYRYRLHRKDLPGKPDIVFPSRRKIVWVHGCFWHRHPGCKYNRMPASNQSYWTPKLEINVVRDEQALYQVTAEGWEAMVVWECEIKDSEELLRRLTEFLGK